MLTVTGAIIQHAEQSFSGGQQHPAIKSRTQEEKKKTQTKMFFFFFSKGGKNNSAC